jgi:hypothetical protein
MSHCNIPLPLFDLILSHLSIAEILELAYISTRSRDVILNRTRIERYLSCNYSLGFDSNALIEDYHRVCDMTRDRPCSIVEYQWKQATLPWAKIVHTLHLTTTMAQRGLNSFIPYSTNMLDGSRWYRYINLLRPSLVRRRKELLYLDCSMHILLSERHSIDDVVVELVQASDYSSATKTDSYNVLSFRRSEFINIHELEKKINDILLRPLNEGYGLLPDKEEICLPQWLGCYNPLFVIQKM